jgi:hypothetical protein
MLLSQLCSVTLCREIMHVVQSQLLGVAFSFMRNFGMLSGASGIFGILSTGVATIGMDSR